MTNAVSAPRPAHGRTKWVWPLILVALVVALAIGSWPTNNGPVTEEQRVAQLSNEIRCPTCAGLSAAESESPLAQSSRQEIARQVQAGATDDEVKEYFVNRYGNDALMTPPRQGVTAWAWSAPVVLAVAAVAGVFFAVRRWRRRQAGPLSETDEALVARAMAAGSPRSPGVNSVLLDERDFLFDALRKLDHEHRIGALTDEEYEGLRGQQVERLAVVLRDIATPVVETKRKATTWKLRAPKSRQRSLWAVAVAAFVIVAGGAVLVSVNDRGANDEITGSTGNDTNSLLARAAEQTANGQSVEALQTYDQVLRLDAANAQALAYRGWLIRLAGLTDEGERSVDLALESEPNYADAHFFKGYILLRDRNDPAGAIQQFDAFLANNPPEDLVLLVQQARTDAEAQLNASTP